MKQGATKTRRKTPIKKVRPKKLGDHDRFTAILVAAILIVATGVFSLCVFYFSSTTRSDDLAELQPDQAPAPERLKENAPPPASPVVQQIPAARPTPSVQPVPAVDKIPASRSIPEAQPNSPTPAPQATPASQPAPVAKTAPQSTPAAIKPNPVPVKSSVQERGALVFVIDDAGYNLHELEPFLKLDFPITIAVLPGLAYSAEAARRIRAAGKEVFLHQPMESIGGQNPGPGAIYSGMGREEIRSIIIRNLEEIGPVAGMNNHEGSKITMDAHAMETIIALCRERGITFLDSRTTAETVAPNAASRLGIRIAERDIFIDNEKDRASMKGYIKTGLNRAEQNGKAIMIGHVQSPELAPLLAEMVPELKASGYSLTSISALINRAGL